LTTFDEQAFAGANPARTRLHMISIMRRLAEVSVLQPAPTGVPPEHLTRRAYPLALELYPDLLAKRVNAVPLGRLWLPVFDRKYGGLLLAVMVAGPVLLYLGFYFRIAPIMYVALKWGRVVLEAAADLTPRSWSIWVKAPWFLLLTALMYFPPLTL